VAILAVVRAENHSHLLVDTSKQTSPCTMVSFDYYLSDQSPSIIYSPFRDGDVSSGWASSYTLQNTVQWTQDTLGPGTSSHNTTASGATATLSFNGTQACALGKASSSSDFSLLCDTSTAPSSYSADFVACCGNLTMGQHSITLRATSPFLSVSPLAFMGFRVWTDLESAEG
jgi:hypothetical protein